MQFLIFAHPLAIDPILPPPNPLAFAGERAARCDRVFISGADQAEKLPLGDETFEWFAGQCAAQVLRERTPLPHGEDTGFRAWVFEYGGNIRRGKGKRIRVGLEAVANREETI